MTDGYKAKRGRDSSSTSDAASGGDEFPYLCETCLGPNPFVKMIKLPYGKSLCKFTKDAFQSFRWKAGPQGRYKETIISYTIAKQKNICQSCLSDMQFGLPVGVRDQLLRQAPTAQQQIAIPQSEIGLKHYHENLKNNGDLSANQIEISVENVAQANQLTLISKLKHTTSNSFHETAFRNLPKLCTFWLASSCSRGKRCPFRPCCGMYVFPELASTNKELMNDLIRQLEESTPEKVQKALSTEVVAAFKNALKGNKEESIKKRVRGEDQLSAQYVNMIKTMKGSVPPPEDTSIKTLWVGNIDDDITDDDLRTAFYPFGIVLTVNIVRKTRIGFVEYHDRPSAEYAMNCLYGALIVKGRTLALNWAKPKSKDSSMLGYPIHAMNQFGTLLPPPSEQLMYTSSFHPPPPTGLPPSNQPVYYPSMNPHRLGSSDAA